MNPAPPPYVSLRRQLLAWYRANRRDWPWRKSRDPYRIWVAEIMLQQTRISAVLPYYTRFLRRFPNVQALARARENELLRLWAGLGYYSRARNLRLAAREIVRRYGAIFPREPSEAQGLPGIGRYTAAAILSIAYQAPLAVLDGNVARVLARLFAIRGDVRAPRQSKRLRRIAQQLLAIASPGDWNQAMMELGETLCTPRSPSCTACPLRGFCQAHALGIAERLPAPRPRRLPELVRVAAAVLLDPQGRTLLTRLVGRHDAVLFSRLWQFPAVRVARGDPARELAGYLRDALGLPMENLLALPQAKHAVTFRKIVLLPFLIRVEALPRRSGSRVLPLGDLPQVPISNATRKIASAALRAVGR